MGWWLVKMVLTPLLRVGLPGQVEGRHHVPHRGGGHPGLQPQLLHGLALPARRAPPAHHLRGQGRVFRQPEDGLVLQGVGQIPLRRGPGSEWRRALDSAAAVLAEGHLFGIYPEGTRSKDGSCTGATPGSPASRCRPARRSSPSASWARAALPIGRKFAQPFTSSTSASGRRSLRVRPAATERMALRQHHRRGHAGHPESVRPGVRGKTPLSRAPVARRLSAAGRRIPISGTPISTMAQSTYPDTAPGRPGSAPRPAPLGFRRRATPAGPIAGDLPRRPASGRHLVGAGPHPLGQPGQVGGPQRGGLGHRRSAQRHAEEVGLELAQDVHDRGAAVDPQLGDRGAAGRLHGLDHVRVW